MQTFNGDAAKKQRLVDYAKTFASRIGDGQRDRHREKLFWSQRQWCPSQYICQKGPDCDHRFCADEIGVPVAIAYCERALFLELPTSEARIWWPRFLQALPVGVGPEISKKWFPAFALKLLTDEQHGLITFAANEEQMSAIRQIGVLFKDGCTDVSAWEAAAIIARDVYHKGPYNNNRMNATDAFIQAGAEACHCAANLAWSFSDERRAAVALMWSGWCARYRQYSNYMSAARDPREDVHKVTLNGIDHVDVSESLAATCQWIRISEMGDREGEVARANYATWVADQLINTIDPTARYVEGRRPAFRLIERILA